MPWRRGKIHGASRAKDGRRVAPRLIFSDVSFLAADRRSGIVVVIALFGARFRRGHPAPAEASENRVLPSGARREAR